MTDNVIIKGTPSYTALPKGFGPRHMAITTNLKGDQKAYVLNEKMPFITIFQLNENTGELTQQYNVETLPANQYTDSGEYGSEIVLHPSENWLYASHRGTGSIIVYGVSNDGLLKRIQVGNIMISFFYFHLVIFYIFRDIDQLNFITIFTQVQLTSGTWPRHFTLSKSGKLMFVALQKKNLIDVFRIDQKNGTLSRLKTIDSPNSPAFVGIF